MGARTILLAMGFGRSALDRTLYYPARSYLRLSMAVWFSLLPPRYCCYWNSKIRYML